MDLDPAPPGPWAAFAAELELLLELLVELLEGLLEVPEVALPQPAAASATAAIAAIPSSPLRGCLITSSSWRRRERHVIPGWRPAADRPWPRRDTHSKDL
jgi:hypothetical protein